MHSFREVCNAKSYIIRAKGTLSLSIADAYSVLHCRSAPVVTQNTHSGTHRRLYVQRAECARVTLGRPSFACTAKRALLHESPSLTYFPKNKQSACARRGPPPGTSTAPRQLRCNRSTFGAGTVMRSLLRRILRRHREYVLGLAEEETSRFEGTGRERGSPEVTVSSPRRKHTTGVA